MTSKNDKIRILEVPSELGAGTRGASLGIGAMKVAALISGNNYFSKYLITTKFAKRTMQNLWPSPYYIKYVFKPNKKNKANTYKSRARFSG